LIVLETEERSVTAGYLNRYPCIGEYPRGNVEGRQEGEGGRCGSHELRHPPGTLRMLIRPEVPMQILYPFSGSIQQYNEQRANHPHRPCSCALCGCRKPLRAHGYYWRTVSDPGFDGRIRVHRYLCLACHRTISLLPEFVLPYVRFAITFIAAFLKARLFDHKTLKQSAAAAGDSRIPYQRGQQWVRRFCGQASAIAAALAALTRPPEAPDFVARTLTILETTGWVTAHHFLFERLRMHLLGWPSFLAPDGRRCAL
jgi:hypothetical protein